MVGMPGFHHAVQLAKENELIGSIGIHLNITEGYPRTNTIKKFSPFVDPQSGRFSFSVQSSCLWMPSTYVQGLREEFSQQIECCIKEGIFPTHIDSHHHIHNIWPIGSIVLDLAKKYRIPYIRIARNIGQGITFAKRIFKAIYNKRLKMHNVIRSDFMGSPSDYIYQPKASRFRIEIMLHPCLTSDGRIIIDSYEKRQMDRLLKNMNFSR